MCVFSLFKKSRETGVCERALCFLGVSIEGAGTKQPILHQNGQCLKKPIIHIFLVNFKRRKKEILGHLNFERKRQF